MKTTEHTEDATAAHAAHAASGEMLPEDQPAAGMNIRTAIAMRLCAALLASDKVRNGKEAAIYAVECTDYLLDQLTAIKEEL